MKRLALEEDRISSLPDCLLVEILSRLDDTKYAIRTGALSKRWQHLWPQLSNLSFTHRTDRKIHQFYSSLERILQTQTQVNKLKLHAYYNIFVIDCIHSAISRNVQEVDFDISHGYDLWTCRGDAFILPDFFFTCSSFIRVSVCGCVFDPAGVISWENLRTLHINAFLDEDMIENILSGCPLLETLELDRCFGFEQIDIITNKSVKNLGFSEYRGEVFCMDIIQINAPYILSLAIKGKLMLKDLMLLNVSSLINVELNYSKERYFWPVDIREVQETNEEMLKGHLLSLAHAKEVKIGELCLETLARLKAKGFVIPSNLKVIGEIASG